ncbi:MAG TPA: glycoside hydrolase family 15 protein [Candidatus Saccharimonadales bacterium]|nr:glycoside hydrolase family 15 protein [Candidatus Saccharimonadales bacterium]
MDEPLNQDSAVDELVFKSVGIIADNQTLSGAYPASPNFEPYKYCWFRDGSFIADAMSRAGQVKSAEQFFDWCADIILARKSQIENGQPLDARYTYDGQAADGDWQTFQLDGYGLWLWALAGHARRTERPIDKYRPAIDLSILYLEKHWQEPCFDWWEETKGVYPATLACIFAGLAAFNHPKAEQVRQAIDIKSARTDASLLICPVLGAVSQEGFAPTLADIEQRIVDPEGGVHRYADDEYYGGGQWILLAGLLGWQYMLAGRREEARQKLDWIVRRAQPNGWLAEQLPNHLLKPVSYQSWLDRLGPPANPLLWSQAMFITLASVLKT